MTTIPVNSKADFDAAVTTINGGNAASYDITLDSNVTIDNDTLTPNGGAPVEIDGPDALTVSTGHQLTASGTLTLTTNVSGDAYTSSTTSGATIALNGAELTNGSSSSAPVLSGTVRGTTTTDSVDNFGQIAVPLNAATEIAVYMDGGSVTNEAAGTIQGGLGGIVFAATGTVTNDGTVTGGASGYGVYLLSSGTVTNGSPTDTTALIQSSGSNAVEIDGAGTVTNSATIRSTGLSASGAYLASGTVNNGLAGATGAIIEGGEFGVAVTGGAGTITNLGTIEASDTTDPGANLPVAGAVLNDGGTLYNGLTAAGGQTNSAAAITGLDYGVLVQGAAGTVYNSGTISGVVGIAFDRPGFGSVAGTVLDNGTIASTSGANGVAIAFGTGNSRLELGSGYTITGKVVGGSGAGDTTTLELTNGTGTFTGLTGGSGSVTNGFAFQNVTAIQIDSGATWSFSGVNDIASLVLQSGGTANVAASGTLEVGGAAGVGTLSLGSNAALTIDTANNYTGDVIAQFAVGNDIDLKDVVFSNATFSFTPAGNSSSSQLQVTSGSNVANLAFAGSNFTALSNFAFSADGQGGTIVTVACYCPGTRVATPGGEVAIETLAIGDLVTTADGRAEPIRWIGRRSYAGRFLAANPKVQPIRFRAGSLGDGLPRRDLMVSPEHAMFLDGLLVPARCLVNGAGITAERHLAAVEYIHIELWTHDLILAEGAASETFIDDDSRAMFHNAHEFDLLYPDAASQPAYCMPRVEDGYELEAIRQRLAGDALAA